MWFYEFKFSKQTYILVIPATLICFRVLLSGYNYFRNLPVRVKCWFCGDATRVPPGNKNCWDCPHCEQYNGFKENGDYNKPIPAQYDESLNFPITALQVCRRFPATNGLCNKCNNHQAVKIKLLSSFIPLNQSNFDNEVDEYEYHLEKLYPLCQRCLLYVQQKLITINDRLSNVVSNGDLVMKESHYSTRTWFVYAPVVAHLCAIFCLSLLLFQRNVHLMSVLPSSQLIVVTGFLLSLSAAAFAQRMRWYLTDAFEIFMWILVLLLISMSFSNEDVFLARLAILSLAIVISSVNMLNRQFDCKTPTVRQYKMKRINNLQMMKNISQNVVDNLPMNLDQVHITPPKLLIHSVGNPFKRKLPTVLAPSRFPLQPITRASWVAGGFWSTSGSNFKKSTCTKFVSSAFLTPPPSVNGSQDSQCHSLAGSLFGDELYCHTCTCNSSASSWTTSKVDKGCNTNCGDFERRKRNFGHYFLSGLVIISFAVNAVFMFGALKN